MAIHDDALADLLKSAYTKLTIVSEKRNKLRIFIQNIEEISRKPNEDDPTIMENKSDRLLGTKLTDARRQSVYDKLLLDKDKLDL